MFLKDKKFWLNLLLALLGAGLLVLLGFFGLSRYTMHNQTMDVPDVVGHSYKEAKADLERKGFVVEVIDSLYEIPAELKNADIQFGDVMVQNPKPNEKVKKGRRFYLTIRTSSPPLVEMPNLVDLTVRQSKAMLESIGLVMGESNSNTHWPVNRQLYNGQEIKPGTKIPKGSVIILDTDSIDLGNGDELMEKENK